MPQETAQPHRCLLYCLLGPIHQSRCDPTFPRTHRKRHATAGSNAIRTVASYSTNSAPLRGLLAGPSPAAFQQEAVLIYTAAAFVSSGARPPKLAMVNPPASPSEVAPPRRPCDPYRCLLCGLLVPPFYSLERPFALYASSILHLALFCPHLTTVYRIINIMFP
jgi:hypothetical protein